MGRPRQDRVGARAAPAAPKPENTARIAAISRAHRRRRRTIASRWHAAGILGRPGSVIDVDTTCDRSWLVTKPLHLALGLLTAALVGSAAAQPPVDESALPQSEKRIPPGHYCKR